MNYTVWRKPQIWHAQGQKQFCNNTGYIKSKYNIYLSSSCHTVTVNEQQHCRWNLSKNSIWKYYVYMQSTHVQKGAYLNDFITPKFPKLDLTTDAE